MKIRFLPPLLSLAAGLAWIGYQHRRLETLAQEDAGMRQQIAAAQHSRRTPAEEAGSATPAHGPKAWKAVVKDHQIRWDLLAELISDNSSILTAMRLEALLKRQFATMTPAEMEAEYDRMLAMDLPAAERQRLRKALVDEIAEKDPGWVVQHPDPEDSDQVSWQIQNNFMAWASKDLPGAMEWMDRQIAAGGFDLKAVDGGNERWEFFEEQVLPRLYQTDPAAAFARLEKMPQELRAEALRGVFPGLEPEQWQTYMGSVRASLQDEGYGEVLREAGKTVADKGLDSMDAFITATHASPEERKQMVELMVEKQFSENPDKLPDTAALDALHAWGMKQAPGDIASITGKSLGYNKGDFKARADLALHYAQQGNGDGDALLHAFLTSSAATPADAAPVLEQISDEALRKDAELFLKTTSEPSFLPPLPE